MENLKIRNEKMIKVLKELNFEIIKIDENITNVVKSFGKKYISIYFNNLVKTKENEFDEFNFNTYYLYNENDKVICYSKNINDIFEEIY